MRALLALLLTGPAFAAVGPTTHHIDGYSVTDQDSFSAVSGNSLVWYWDGPITGPFTIYTDIVHESVGYGLTPNLSWRADQGRSITGFTVVYDLEYAAGTNGAPDPSWNGARGDFYSNDGAGHSFSGVDTPMQALRLEHQVQGDAWSPSFWIGALGRQETCVPSQTGSAIECPPGFAISYVQTMMSLRSITITPHVVTAIPEPSTYALMLLGLGLLAYRPKGWRKC